ncbi:MAG TPA: GxxExxY protein [Longimicrobiaceae bacterium]|nr:GxxExxY protein [Longimicrobiaceae bacterium]
MATQLVDSVIAVHRELGCGLLESTYQACLIHELRLRGLDVESEISIPIRYKRVLVEAGYRIDMLVEDLILVENKSVHAILPIHMAQVLTYLRLSGRTLGFLINWNVLLIKDGIHRISNGHPDSAETRNRRNAS